MNASPGTAVSVRATNVASAQMMPDRQMCGKDIAEKLFGSCALPIPIGAFSEAEIERAAEIGHYAILQVSTTADGKPITICRMEAMRRSKHSGQVDMLTCDGDSTRSGTVSWYARERFYTHEVPAYGWKLVTRSVIPDSVGRDYIGQTQAIADYLVHVVYRTRRGMPKRELPELYRRALAEFGSRREELETLRRANPRRCLEIAAALRINRLFRERAVEVCYGLMMTEAAWGLELLDGLHTWTASLSSMSAAVTIGRMERDVYISDDIVDRSDKEIGVRFCRAPLDPSGTFALV